ncbi:hypothetical protein CEXT_805401 [Caerostris extrusa]|uniref:Uncharacterized protein n=1 Tax=Caerostris extrusa TaxID=172846 RepID=A0AAV4W726_CAEEX|nr:hypothetical protein CEXT_805401 [Caerostris extrusa]
MKRVNVGNVPFIVFKCSCPFYASRYHIRNLFNEPAKLSYCRHDNGWHVWTRRNTRKKNEIRIVHGYHRLNARLKVDMNCIPLSFSLKFFNATEKKWKENNVPH